MNDAAKVRKHLVHDLTCAVCWRLAGVYGSSSRQTGSAALESVSLIKLVMDISDYQSNYDCKNTRKSIRIFVSNIKVEKRPCIKFVFYHGYGNCYPVLSFLCEAF